MQSEHGLGYGPPGCEQCGNTGFRHSYRTKQVMRVCTHCDNITEVPWDQNAWNIDDYIKEEVTRQGHNINDPHDGGARVEWMHEAWDFAKGHSERFPMPGMGHMLAIAQAIEPHMNHGGFRQHGVTVGWRVCPPWEGVPRQVEHLWTAHEHNPMPVEKFYKEFEEIHPFGDGNGRTGKVIYNWMKGSLDKPHFPPNFWGSIP